MTIIIPRHINRTKAIYSSLKKMGLKIQIKNENDPVDRYAEIVLVNYYGSVTKYLKSFKQIFIGKSLLKKLERVGGQNPIEAAKMGCYVYHGPYVYNFQEVYALDTQDRPLYNIITDQQKERAREVFELLGNYAGVQFVETDNQGITVATGDLQAIAQEEGEEVDRSLLGLGGMNSSGNPIAVMDGEDFTASGTDLYGDIWFQTAMKVIQQTLGIGYTDELSPRTLSGDWETNPADANPFLAGHQDMLVTDPMFPGHHDQIHLQHLYRKDSIDIDVYQFVVSFIVI